MEESIAWRLYVNPETHSTDWGEYYLFKFQMTEAIFLHYLQNQMTGDFVYFSDFINLFPKGRDNYSNLESIFKKNIFK